LNVETKEEIMKSQPLSFSIFARWENKEQRRERERKRDLKSEIKCGYINIPMSYIDAR
jgi:hypothetical protein